jgi:hypothetical protein
VSGPTGDWIYGGAGTDTAVCSDVLANYQFEWRQDHPHVVQLNADQNNLDSLFDVEFLQFAAVTVAAPTRPQTLYGSVDDDNLAGAGGFDTLYGRTDPSELWFEKRNSDLVIYRLGTQDSVTLAGWRSSPCRRLSRMLANRPGSAWPMSPCSAC